MLFIRILIANCILVPCVTVSSISSVVAASCPMTYAQFEPLCHMSISRSAQDTNWVKTLSVVLPLGEILFTCSSSIRTENSAYSNCSLTAKTLLNLKSKASE